MSKSHNKKLIEAVRQKAHVKRNGVFVPRTEGDVQTNWPVCQTCKQDVEAVEMKNQNSFGVEIWAKCHGKEDWYTVTYPYRIEGNDQAVQDHIRVAMRAFLPFKTSIVL